MSLKFSSHYRVEWSVFDTNFWHTDTYGSVLLILQLPVTPSCPFIDSVSDSISSHLARRTCLRPCLIGGRLPGLILGWIKLVLLNHFHVMWIHHSSRVDIWSVRLTTFLGMTSPVPVLDPSYCWLVELHLFPVPVMVCHHVEPLMVRSLNPQSGHISL